MLFYVTLFTYSFFALYKSSVVYTTTSRALYTDVMNINCSKVIFVQMLGYFGEQSTDKVIYKIPMPLYSVKIGTLFFGLRPFCEFH